MFPSWFIRKCLSVKEKNKIAERIRSSRKYLDESYTKLFQMNPFQQQPKIKQEENLNNQVIPVDETSTYKKQKKRSTSY
jgi:hypothetical protein